jgi:hypothetical protein
MDNPTRVQSTVDFDEVPQWVLEQVEHRAFGLLRSACEELSHVVDQAHSQGVDANSLAHHIERARKIIFDADLIMQDAHSTAVSYLEYAPPAALTPKLKGGSVDEEIKTDEREPK